MDHSYGNDLSKIERERLETWGWTPREIDDAVAALRQKGISVNSAEDIDASGGRAKLPPESI
jgi:hypothetical protein